MATHYSDGEISMAEKRETWTKLYAPDGTPVEVAGEERAETLKGRGYTTNKPRATNRPPAGGGGDDAEVTRLREQLAQATRERDEALAAATTPAPEKK